ncbi:MAG: taurine dioxygenase [Rhodospirillaceae bacterium]|jgi:taurine dioxygenase|nr:taurine dioxygenase [Rhodospirillaceae bacterium]MBT5663999.1 taurine dioxygenase [Rhodospirillaceae bacterium]
MSYKHIEVKPVSGAIGAEIHGVDLSQENIEQPVVDEIRQALLDYLVIFFHGQAMDDDVLVRFGRRFGELAALPPHRQVPGSYPELLVIDKKPEDTMVFGWEWHSDTSHLETPSLGSILYAKIVPPSGGDTLFANQYLAYDALSDGMKSMLDGLVAVHANGRILRTLAEGEIPPPGTESESAGWSEMSAEHPLVRTHPETGRKALYVNELHTERLKDMTVDESQPLLQFLYKHSSRPEFTCRFQWQVGSVAFWDNRSSMHLALNDYQGQRRLMHRVQVKGDCPV